MAIRSGEYGDIDRVKCQRFTSGRALSLLDIAAPTENHDGIDDGRIRSLVGCVDCLRRGSMKNGTRMTPIRRIVADSSMSSLGTSNP